MAEIAPLTPLRYALDRLPPHGLGCVVSPPYDVIDAEARAELVARDPHNVVRLELPEGEGDAKYAHAGELLAKWRAEGVLTRDNEPSFYRYDQTFQVPAAAPRAEGRADVHVRSMRTVTRRGFFALVKLARFDERIVLPHERTLSGPKEDRLKLFRATSASVSPGFMLYRDPRGDLDAPLDTGDVLAQFNTPDGIHHVLAKVTGPDALRAITEGLATSTLLIADGHHRYETAVAYRDEVDAAKGGGSPKGEHRYGLTFLVNGDDPNLVVLPTHRHVHCLPNVDFARMLEHAAATFTVEPLPAGAAASTLTAALHGKQGAFVAADRSGAAALLTLRSDVDLARHPTLGRVPQALRGTDVAVLHGAVLEHVLGITKEAQAAKTNLWYPQDAVAALEALRGGKGDVLFLMNPTPASVVRGVAEAGEVMPQKSTFFFPKVPTGLLIHTLDPDRFVPIVL